MEFRSGAGLASGLLWVVVYGDLGLDLVGFVFGRGELFNTGECLATGEFFATIGEPLFALFLGDTLGFTLAEDGLWNGLFLVAMIYLEGVLCVVSVVLLKSLGEDLLYVKIFFGVGDLFVGVSVAHLSSFGFEARFLADAGLDCVPGIRTFVYFEFLGDWLGDTFGD